MTAFLIFLPSTSALGTGPEQQDEGEGDFEDFAELDMEDLLGADEYSTTGSFAGMVSSASRHEQDIGESPSAITVITREQIENTSCLDVACVLREVPEALVMEARPMFSAVGARAMVDDASARVLVLVDGQEMNNDVFGIVLWETFPVHLDDIERIEVIRGPGSALYGANAHSMVVSIFTRRPAEDTARVFVAAGERNRTSLNARAGRAFESWKIQLSGGMDTADSWDRPDYAARETAYGRLATEVKLGDSVLVGRAALSVADGRINTFLGPNRISNALFGSFFLAYLSDLMQVRLSGNIFSANLPFEYRDIVVEDILLGRMPEIIPFDSGNLAIEPQLMLAPFEGNLLILGSNYRFLTASSANTDPGSVDQHGLGVFLQDEQKLGEFLNLTGSVRLDYNSLTPLTLSPRLATVFRFSPTQFARLSFGMAFRKPSIFETSVHLNGVEAEPGFEELSDFVHTAFGNEDLHNERILSMEAGYIGRFLDQALVLEADAFYNQYRDTIVFNVHFARNSLGIPSLRESSAGFLNNGREADSVGGMLALTWRLGRVFRLHANYSYRYSFFTSDPAGLSASVDVKKGDRVPWEPEHLANLGASYTPESGLRAGLFVHLVSSRMGLVSESGGALDPRVLVSEPTHVLVNAFVSWRATYPAAWMEVGVRAFDLLGTAFRDIPGFANPQTDNYSGGEELDRRVTLFVRGGF